MKSTAPMQFRFVYSLLAIVLLTSCSLEDSVVIPEPDNNGGIHIGDLIIRSQATVQFYGDLEYTEIQGNLNIASQTDDPITDLTPLRTIRKARALIITNNNDLVSLEGLENLDDVESVFIESNFNLENVDDLTINNTSLLALALVFVPKLTSTNAFDGVEEVNNFVLDGAGFSSLNSFSNLKRVTRYLIVEDMPFLEDLSGLGVEYVGEEVRIRFNPVLASTSGIESWTDVGIAVDMELWGNPALQNIDGFLGLTSINKIMIKDNDALENLDGFSNLTSVTNDAEIRYNDDLGDFCGLVPVVSSGGFVGNLEIRDNEFNPSYSQLEQGDCVE